MTSAVKRSRTVALSAEKVLELEQKGDGMSSGEESDLYRQLQHTSDRSRYKLSCVTVLLRKYTMRFNFRSFYSLVLAVQSTTVIALIPLEFILTETAFACLERHFLFLGRRLLNFMQRTDVREELYILIYSVFCRSFNFRRF